jgi:hypothetical protein
MFAREQSGAALWLNLALAANAGKLAALPVISPIVALDCSLYMLSARRVIDRCSDMSRVLLIAASAIICTAYAGTAVAYRDGDYGWQRAPSQSCGCNAVSDFSAVSRSKPRQRQVSRRHVWPFFPWEADGWEFEKRYLTFTRPPIFISDGPCPIASVCRPLQLLY